MKDLIIRDAKKNDSSIIAKLIYSTEDHPDHVWGNGSKEEILARIEFLIISEFSRYSYRNIKVAEYKGIPCGAITLLPSEKISNMDIKTSLKLISLIKGFTRKLNFIKDILLSMSLEEGGDGELYIANIATSEEFRGKGIGKALMRASEVVAKEKGYKGCSLLAKDESVMKYYEKFDYIFTEKQLYFSQSLYKMVKMI